MTLRFVTIVSLAVLGLSGQALAQTTLGSLYQDTNSKSCPESCLLKFNQIPLGKAVVVEQVSCTLVDNGSSRGAVLAGAKGTSISLEQLPLLVTKQSASGGTTVSFLTGTGPFIIFGDLRPAVGAVVPGGTSTTLKCAISGTIRKVPAQ